MPNTKSLSLTVQKLKQMLKLTTDNQTDKQTNRQDKNNMQPIIRSGGIKTTDELMFATPAIYYFH